MISGDKVLILIWLILEKLVQKLHKGNFSNFDTPPAYQPTKAAPSTRLPNDSPQLQQSIAGVTVSQTITKRYKTFHSYRPVLH